MKSLFGSNELGTDKIERVFIDTFKVAQELGEAAKDGIQLIDAWVLYKNSDEIKDIYENSRDAWRQFKDLTPAEAEQVVKNVSLATGEPENKVEEKVLKGLKLVSKTYQHAAESFNLFNDWKDLVTS